MEQKKKIHRCIYSHLHLKGDYTCVQAGWDDDKVVETNEQKCEDCKLFESRYIEYPITVTNIATEKIEYNKDTYNGEMGMLVAVRPCSDNEEKKTYIGFFIGNLPLCITAEFNKKTGVLTQYTFTNPAIYVPELEKIIFGCDSWWYRIESEDQLRQISDEAINNVWYVKAIKKLSE